MITVKSKQGHSIEFTDVNAERNDNYVSFRCSDSWLYDHGPGCEDCSAFIRYITKGIDEESRIARGGGLVGDGKDGNAWTIQTDNERERIIDFHSFAQEDSHFDNLLRVDKSAGVIQFRFRLLPLDQEAIEVELKKSVEAENYLRCHVLQSP